MNGGKLQFIVATGGDGAPRKIAVRLAAPASPGAPTLIWFPGFRSDMGSVKAAALAGFAAERGFGCLRFDYSGHGQSCGKFEDGSISDWIDEAQAVLALAPAGSPLIFVGSSMGAWIALNLAARLRVETAGLVLIAPAWDMTRLMWERGTEEARQELLRTGVYHRVSAYSPEPYPITLRLIEDGRRWCFNEGPVAVSAPVRILHGQRDSDIPWQHSLALAGQLTGDDVRLTLIKDGEHRLSRPQDLAALFGLIGEIAGIAQAG
jgi:pimeloyl-ACP methyl ester carboxylesterase